MVDAFAQKCNAQFPRYWSQAQDAFSEEWGREHLWINAPFSTMQDVVLKAIMDQAQRIMIVPVWKAHDWFWELRDSLGLVRLAGGPAALSGQCGFCPPAIQRLDHQGGPF